MVTPVCLEIILEYAAGQYKLPFYFEIFSISSVNRLMEELHEASTNV